MDPRTRLPPRFVCHPSVLSRDLLDPFLHEESGARFVIRDAFRKLIGLHVVGTRGIENQSQSGSFPDTSFFLVSVLDLIAEQTSLPLEEARNAFGRLTQLVRAHRQWLIPIEFTEYHVWLSYA